MNSHLKNILFTPLLLKATNRIGIRWLLFVLLFGFISCDSMQQLQGYVVDAETGQPISGVKYRKYDRKRELQDTIGPYGLIQSPQTDSLGRFSDFKIDNPLRPRMKLHFEKDGYKPADIKWKPQRNNKDTLKVLLEKYNNNE